MFENELKNAYIWSDWILFEETNFKHSSYSKNWYLNPGWWWSATSFTYTAYDTTNGRLYSTGTHWYAGLYFTSAAYNIIGSATKFRIVYDYLYTSNNTASYWSWPVITLAEFYKKSWSYSMNWYRTWISTSPELQTLLPVTIPHSAILDYDIANDSGLWTFTNLNTQAKATATMTWLSQYWNQNVIFNWSRSVGAMMWWLLLDKWTTSYFWDMHIYYQ